MGGNEAGADPAVTVIIPAYNAAAHLPACLSAVLAQTLTDLEIICVDDASTDLTPAILADFAARDSRFRLISQVANRGEGASRNIGLDSARGEYLFHLDADDTIPTKALERLYCTAKRHNSDMVRGSFEKLFADGRREIQRWPIPSAEIGNTCIGESALLQQLPPSHCAYLYRRQFVRERQLRYPQDLMVGLDLVALASALINAQSVAIIPDVVYQYRQSSGSVTRGSFPLKLPLDAIEARRRAVATLQQNGFSRAAMDRLAGWGFDINRYWLRIPDTLALAEARQVFGAVRSLLADYGAMPWRVNAGHHHRYLLALIMAGRDAEALDFLTTAEIREGFSDTRVLKESLLFVLQVAPDDVGALYRLGVLARQDGESKQALGLLRRVLHIDPQHEQAQRQLRQMLQARTPGENAS